MINKTYDYIYFFSLINSVFFLSGCSGGEADYTLDDINPTFQGKFIDEAVEGLEYTRSNGESGVTRRGGSYEYKNGDLITFYVGALELGTTSSGTLLTPRELAIGTSVIEDQKISNRVRFLLALDSDPKIGIQINNATRSSAASWSTSINFDQSEAAFGTAVEAATNNNISAADLPSKIVADAHFARSLRCAYSGGYVGAWKIPGSDATTGFVGAMIEANGHVVVMGGGQTVDGQEDTVVYVTGTHDVNNQAFRFDTADSSITSGAFYYDRDFNAIGDGKLIVYQSASMNGNGQSHNYSYISGTFQNDTQQGAYELHRADALTNAAYRYTGFGITGTEIGKGDVLGMLIFDIDASGHVDGMIHDVRTPMKQVSLSGQADYINKKIEIFINNAEKSRLYGTVNFNDTTGEAFIDWFPDAVNQLAIGHVQLRGCQLQAID